MTARAVGGSEEICERKVDSSVTLVILDMLDLKERHLNVLSTECAESSQLTAVSSTNPLRCASNRGESLPKIESDQKICWDAL